jgi:hypothetical protein
VPYVAFGDISARWVYTKRGARKVIEAPDFPAPQFAVNGGRTKIWWLPDIERYEHTHPELKSQEAKRRKVAGYAIAITRKRKAQSGGETA